MEPSLRTRAIEVLETASVGEKARLTREYVRWWLGLAPDAKLVSGTSDSALETPSAAARQVSEVRRGREKKAGAKGLVHALCHAEGCAIDCFWDLVARFSRDVEVRLGAREAVAFCDDAARIAFEEATHFERLVARLEALGLHYGDLAATDTLAASMADTSDDCLARLAIVHLVHEARGLDVYHVIRARLERAGDAETARVVDLNYTDEIQHVKVMKHWFEKLAHASDPATPARDRFFAIVRDRRRWKLMGLKGPFNDEARREADMPSNWYEPLEVAD